MARTDGREQPVGEQDTEVCEPPMYRVMLLNDDYTPMDFVVMVLRTVFHKDEPMARQIMMDIHRQGSGVCGVYTFEVAETKVHAVESLAETNKHPLRCTMEEAS
jgi:ATP-dependent Clp protease adaptor protein ClpS